VQPIPSANQLISTSFYQIANRVLRIEALDDWSSRFIVGFLDRFHFKRISAEEGTGAIDYTVRISCDEPPRVPPHLETFEVQRGLCHTNWQSDYLSIDESLIFVDAPPVRSLDVWIGQTAHARHPVALANLMSYAMQAAMRRTGLYELHAAGVVEPTRGRGALLIGNSNCGKSTITTRLANDGWGYLSDDMLVLSEASGQVEARGLRRHFAVSPVVVEGWKLPRLKDALGGPIPSDSTKRSLDPSIVFPKGFTGLCVPLVLLFPSITGEAKTRIEKLSQSDAMMRLITACAWARYDRAVARDYLQVLAMLVRQSASFALHAGHDLLREPELARTLLGKYVTEIDS
jgi:hypothetical protein